MKPSVRSLLAAAVALFFTLTPARSAEEKAAPPPSAATLSAPAAAPATPTPASPAPATVTPPATPADAANPAPEATPELRNLSNPPLQVEKASEPASTPKSKKKGRAPAPPKVLTEEERARRAAREAARTGEDITNVFGDSHLPAGEKTDQVVAVFGSSTAEGEVADQVVAVFGDTRVTGPGVHDQVVTVFGSSYINAPVNGDVVVVFGDLEFGPLARIDGDVVCVFGKITRDPAVVLKHRPTNIGSSKFVSLQGWIELCLRKARPLALSDRVTWAWFLAFAFLSVYVFGALVFRSGVEKCVRTLETAPGFCVISALIATLLFPVLIVLLGVTTAGVVVPFVVIALLCAGLFGKMVMLGWLGKRFTGFLGEGPLAHIAFAVFIGGLIVMALYTVPVVGFLLFNFIGWLGLGVVIYAIAQSWKRARPVAAAPAYAAPATAATAAAYSEPVAPAPVPAAVQPDPFVVGSVPPSDVPHTSAGFVGAAAIPVAPVPEVAGSGAIPADPGVVPPPIQPAPAPVAPPPVAPPPMQSYHLPPPPVRPTPIISASTLPRAGFWIRFGAMAIDGVLIAIITSGMLHSNPLFFVGLAGYAAAMWKYKGTTLGGIICGLKVVRLDDRPLDWPTAIVRALGCFLSMVMMGFGFIWVAFDRDKQSWHDKIAGTTVVLMPKGVSLL